MNCFSKHQRVSEPDALHTNIINQEYNQAS